MQVQHGPRRLSDISVNRIGAIVAFVIFYAIVLQLSYQNLIAPAFAYLGERYRGPSTWSTIVALILTIAVALALPARVRSVGDFTMWVLYLVAVAPSILVAQYADILSRGRAIWLAWWVAIIFLAMVVIARTALPQFSFKLSAPIPLLQIVTIGFTLLMNGYLLVQGGLSLHLVSLGSVQDVRSSYKTLVASVPLLGYALQFQTAVLNPVFMSLGIAKRRPIVLATGVLSQVLIYSVTGYKLTILSPIFVIALALYFKYRTQVTGLVLTVSVTVAMTISLMLDSLMGTRAFVTIFVNRLFAGPGVLTSAYLKVFDGMPKYHWSQSFLSPFYTPPYDLTPGYLVGAVFQHVESQANVSLFGDGYANLGLWGIGIEGAFLLLVLAVLNAAAKHVPMGITIPSTLVAALGLANNSSFTSVLTGGFGGLIVVFALWPRASGDETPDEQHGLPREKRARPGTTVRQQSGRAIGNRRVTH